MKKRLTREEALNYLKDYGTPEHVIRHCIAVTDTALIIGKALNNKGCSFDLELIEGAGLVHDMARIEPVHQEVAADFFLKLGYKEEATVIRAHMTHALPPALKDATETDIVCLGDRLVLEDKYVGIETRMEYVLEKSKDHPEARPIILQRIATMKDLVAEIEKFLGKSIDELILG